MEEKNKSSLVTFAAIDPIIERLIEAPVEKKTGAEYVSWGEKNTYPQYCKTLCKTVPTLRSCVLGLADYVCGDKVIAARNLAGNLFSKNGLTAREIVRASAFSAGELGAVAWLITRNEALDAPVSIEPIKVEYLRMNEEGNVFFYNEKWGKSNANIVIYPSYFADSKAPQSILFVKLWGDCVYPEPLYAASIKACETERSVDEFHLGNIERGFMGSYIVNFNNGSNPTDDERKAIERSFSQKFAGKKNAGRIMFSWNRNKDGMTTLQKMEVADFGEKYETLSKHCRQQIFTAFRCNPNLMGVNTENNGFSDEDFEKSFRLFNRTMVQPIQATILDMFAKVFGVDGQVQIVPFSLDGNGENIEK